MPLFYLDTVYVKQYISSMHLAEAKEINSFEWHNEMCTACFIKCHWFIIALSLSIVNQFYNFWQTYNSGSHVD